MRSLRQAVNSLLPLLGMLTAFGGVLLLEDRFHVLLAVVAGILLIEAGVWQLASPILPSQRKYVELRQEVDDFIQRVRTLNRAALAARSEDPDPAAWEGYRATLAEMHASVNRMGTLAGKEEGGKSTDPPDEPRPRTGV